MSEGKVEKALFEETAIHYPRSAAAETTGTRNAKYRIKEIEAEIKRIKKRRRKWQEAFANDVITLEELRERTQEDREREELLKAELELIPQTAAPPRISRDELIEALKNLRYVWKRASRQERKEMIRGIFSRLVVDKEPGGSYKSVIIKDFDLA
ncbi:hypothetical protein JIR001_16840 [Polycladomyces abyssicola]|uniref:Uncharacterized protein n=1 Tax=Polycladomyces abyssicola TaxID=1125966 RepID=A0A8D5ZP02_9BACL|nr:hypothetical protein [Polycladomyces abyssicola]BCU81901.1 hypothetical protein JIR001_16840 [Polycladomyces abyssicola]